MIVHGFLPESDIKRLWEKIPSKDNVWGEGLTYETYREYMMASPVVVELDFGYIRVERFIYGYAAVVHGIFWDRRYASGSGELLEVARKLRDLLHLAKLQVWLPCGTRSLRRLMKRLGFNFLYRNSSDELWELSLGGL